MLKSKWCLISLLALLSTVALSQSPSPTKITVYKPENNNPLTAPDSATTQLNHLIKWNYYLLGRGVFLLNYEFPIFKKLTGEIGAGLTYRDFIFELSKGYRTESNYEVNTINVAAEAGIRLYPIELDNFEGFYLSPVCSYRKYKFNSSTAPPNTYDSYVLGYTFLDIQFKLGYQYENFWNDDLMSDFYVGVAARNASIHLYEKQSANNGAIVFLEKNKKMQFPQFLFGIKIGLPF